MNIQQHVIECLTYGQPEALGAKTKKITPEIFARANEIVGAIEKLAQEVKKSAEANIKANTATANKKMTYEYLDSHENAETWMKQGLPFEVGMDLVVKHLKNLGFSNVVGQVEVRFIMPLIKVCQIYVIIIE